MFSKRSNLLMLLSVLSFFVRGHAQSQPPDLYHVLMDSAIVPGTGNFPNIYSYNGAPIDLATCGACPTLGMASNFGTSAGPHSIVGLTSSLNATVATELSVIPLASPASGVITKVDPATGAELPASSTLGPIFTERAETIGKGKFYIGVSNQDFHFTSFNGTTLRPLRLLDTAGDTSTVSLNGTPLKSFPATSDVGMDLRLSQNVAFLTYGVTNRFDLSVALPVVHAAISANTFNAQIYTGNGFANGSNLNSNYGNGSGTGNCWCVDTFTAGSPPGSPSTPTGAGLSFSQVNSAALGKTGLGDVLLRFKGTVLERRNVAVGLGADLRMPTGDEKNFLGTGAWAVKPFMAISFYTKPWNNWLVLSPHINVGWQIAGKSILGGQLNPTQQSTPPPPPTVFGQPLTSTKDYLPDVFSWAVGSEVALGKRNTVVVDLLANEIGWIHGIPGMTLQTITNVPLVQATTNTATNVSASGFVSAGRTSFGQYSGAFGYKARLAGNLVGTFNMLVRFDHNGLRAHTVPLFGLSYTL